MIDPVPVGYVTLDQAVTRLARDISDQDVIEEYRRIEEDTPFSWSNFPEAERDRIAAQQKAADISWAKREIAISQLYAALCDGDLTGLVCEDKVFFQLTPADWSHAPFWHEIIIGGIVRASAVDAIARHAGRRVLFKSAAFDKWLKKTRKGRTHSAPAEGNCQACVEPEMPAIAPPTTQEPIGGGSAGEPAAPVKLPPHRDLGQNGDGSTPSHRYLNGPQVCQRYTISDMTLWRWLQDNDLAFPHPLRIRDRRYWLEADLVTWERSHSEWQQLKI